MYDSSMNPALNLSAFLLFEKLCLTGERRLRGRFGRQSSDSPEFSTPPCPPPQSLIDRSTRRDIYHTAKQFGFMYSQKRDCARPLSPNFHTGQDRIHRKREQIREETRAFCCRLFWLHPHAFPFSLQAILYWLRREIINGYYGYTFLPPGFG
jgi:hypothetical protein